MARKKVVRRTAKSKTAQAAIVDDQAESTPTTVVAPAEVEGPTVKITVESYQRGAALFAVRGSRVDVGARTILQFGGTTLYWTKKRWSENHSEAAVLMSNGDLLLELERAKLAAPFQAKASELLVEWKRFMS
jgi:hypothetical protein